MTDALPLSTLPPSKPAKQLWRLVCVCENADRKDHDGQRPASFEGRNKAAVFGLAKRAGWRLSSRWKTAVCPHCTGKACR